MIAIVDPESARRATRAGEAMPPSWQYLFLP
jgi:hypothetical protein